MSAMDVSWDMFPSVKVMCTLRQPRRSPLCCTKKVWPPQKRPAGSGISHSERLAASTISPVSAAGGAATTG